MYELGYTYFAKKDYENALNTARREKAPTAYLTHFNLGLSLMRMNELDEARRALQESLYLRPSHPGSNFYLGRVYAQTGYKIPAALAISIPSTSPSQLA